MKKEESIVSLGLGVLAKLHFHGEQVLIKFKKLEEKLDERVSSIWSLSGTQFLSRAFPLLTAMKAFFLGKHLNRKLDN
jgi:hypothetical protein